ncbi:MAG: hypothetical protein E7163_03580 [Firmicutes bacterium]|nr:hypothetical protein [Bacillota bacterium]
MENQQIKKFIAQVKLESTYRKILECDIIYQLINIFNVEIDKQSYSCEIENPLKIALQFYKEYNTQYYNTIIEQIKSKRIVISQNNGKSFTDTENNTAHIRLYGNDGDLFTIVHELAHFIDRNNNPPIIPDKYWFLSETFAFYIEKKLEIWLKNKKYKDLISTRKNNRIYFENNMLKAIENELYYESLFRQKGTIEVSDIDIKKIKSIMQFDISSNIINYLLQYPLANILSDYIINNHLLSNDCELAEICINIDLYKMLENYLSNKKIKR